METYYVKKYGCTFVAKIQLYHLEIVNLIYSQYLCTI